VFDRSAATGPNAELYSFGCRCVGDLSQRHYPGTSRLVKSREPVLIPRPLSQRFISITASLSVPVMVPRGSIELGILIQKALFDFFCLGCAAMPGGR
jgi:hypothetical protein